MTIKYEVIKHLETGTIVFENTTHYQDDCDALDIANSMQNGVFDTDYIEYKLVQIMQD